MASIRKTHRKNNPWIAQVRTGGFSKSKTFSTKAEAMRWAGDLEIVAGRFGEDRLVEGKTVRELFQRYSDECSSQKKGGKWEVVRLRKISRDRFSLLRVDDVRPNDVEAWVARQTISPQSIRRELNLLSAVFEMAVRWRWCSENPIKRVPLPRKARPRDRRISDEEVSLIVEHLGYHGGKPNGSDQETAAALLLAIETGMRQGELFSLDISECYLDLAFVHLSDTKNGDSRDVPLSTKSVEILSLLIGDRTIGKVFSVRKEYAGILFRKAVRALGLSNLRFHDSRHEAVSRLARKLDVLDFARMIGHRNINTLMIYYNATASEIAKRLG